MKFELTELRSLIRESLTETYFGGATVGNLSSTAFNAVGPNINAGTEPAMDPVDLAVKIRSLIGGDAGFPIGEWSDEILNAAAEACADALLNTYHGKKIERSSQMFEKKKR